MDANKPEERNAHGVAAEPDRIPTSVPVALGLMLVVSLLVSALGVLLIFRGLQKRADAKDRREIAAAGLERPREEPPPAPRLQIDPVASWTRFRSAESAQLSSYGWMDRSAGAVHVPIERAMEIVLERGVGPLAPAPVAIPAPPAAEGVKK
jgi:hypothetical protein